MPSFRVPILDLASENARVRDEIRAEIERIVDESSFVLGPAVTRFEENFAAWCGADHCVTTSNGTSALHLAMRCLDVGPGDEIVTVSMSFVATAWPALYLGATPVFVDIDPERYTLDPDRLAAALTRETRAIVPVHLYGQCADMDAILEVANANGIPVIEDAAQAAGARYKGRRPGSMGTLACWSFYPSKNLGAFGEAGAVTTSSPELAERLRSLRDHAQSQRYIHDEVGYNYRLDSIQAAVLDVKLRHVDAWIEERRKVASEYDHGLADCGVIAPRAFPDGDHAYHLYVIQDEQRDELREQLASDGIQTGLHYPTPIHAQPPFRGAFRAPGGLAVTDDLARRCLSLPIYADLEEAQVRTVIDALRRARGR